MPSYLVAWEIDLEAASPLEAAQKARQIQQDAANRSDQFFVYGEDGDDVTVNVLSEEVRPGT